MKHNKKNRAQDHESTIPLAEKMKVTSAEN